MNRVPLLLSTSFLALAAGPAAADTHPFTVHDMLAMERISDPDVSPDGRWVLYTVRTTDLEANRGRTDVWLSAVDGSQARRMTSHDAADYAARWMPDGRSFVFLSTRGGSAQVWRMPVDGGEPEPLTELGLGVEGCLPFPDGRRLLLAIDVYPDLVEDPIAGTKARDAERAKEGLRARVYESLLFRHWDTWEDGKRSHLFVLEIGGGAPLDLMRGLDADSPVRPFGGMEQVAIHPDGREVVYAARTFGADVAWSTNLDLWSVVATGDAAPVNLTHDNPALDDQPAFSPDGSRIAYLAMERPGYESDRQRIVLMDRAGNDKRVLTGAWDRSAGGVSWSKDGRTLWTTANDVGQNALFAVDAHSGEVRRLVGQGWCSSPLAAGERVLFGRDDLDGPLELYTAAADGGDVRPLTRLNAERVAATRRGTYEQFSFPGWNGETVHGYLVRPVDFDPARKWPVAFLIHGGPQGSFGNHFHYRWNPQAYAGAGFAAVMVDFHGSTGYGQAFTDSIRGDWGGKPYEDLMKGLDFALSEYPFLDGERVAALGASFGGYMINWIAGRTDRFECLVNHDGNLDERMAYYDTEELWFPEWDHEGTPWENPAGYATHNPIDHVGSWKTPMLVIHGALDFRVVDTQGLSTFTALQRRGIPSKLLYFPDENHWVLQPKNSILWHETVIDWIQRWTRDAAAGPTEAGGGAGGR